MDTRFNFLDSPTRTLTEQEFLRPGLTRSTWQDVLIPERAPQLDTLEKLAHSFASPLQHTRPSAVEKSILDAGQTNTLDLRTEMSSERRTENVPALEFIKVFLAPESGSASSGALHKSANPGVARVERDQLEDGSTSVSEYDENNRLIRGYITRDGKLPEMMQKTLIADRETPERVLLPSIFQRRAIA